MTSSAAAAFYDVVFVVEDSALNGSCIQVYMQGSTGISDTRFPLFCYL
jgi:hypothetical protein